MVGITFLLTSCPKEEKVLHLYNWTYYTPEALIEQFEETYGIKVVIDYFASNEDMFAKLKAGAKGYDLVFPSQDYVEIMIHEKMVLPIDHEKIPNLTYISPLVLEKATYDPTMEWSVPYYMGAAGIAVNRKRVSDYPRDWSIFSTKKLANRMSMLDDLREVIGDALAYLGYSVNSVDKKELEEAKRLINQEWKPNLVKFDAEGFAKAFASGEFLVVQGYAEAIYEELDTELWENVDFFLPPSGGPMYLDSMVIPKGANNTEAAHLFINFIHTPEVYAQFLDRFHFPSSVNTAAAPYMTTEPFYHVEDLENYELKRDLGENLTLYNTLWETIRYNE